ncbi:MAG: zf-HC2 domain-containing protein [Candidatus Acidiferrales bacterium]
MSCKEYESRLEELEDYLEGRLDATRAAAVSEHAAACAECRQHLEVAAISAPLLRAAAEPAAPASAAFWTRLAARIREAEEKRRSRHDFFGSLEWLAWRTASAALLIFVVLGGYVITHPSASLAPDQPVAEVFLEPEHPNDPDEVLVTLASRNGARNGR